MTTLGADDLTRMTTFGWYGRRLHNVAMQKYLFEPGKDKYNEIQGILQDALDQLEKLNLDIQGNADRCPVGYCEDNMNNCIPCPEQT